MAHKASQPLNAAAVQAANRALYERHPELVTNGQGRPLSPNSAQDRALRTEWMASYAQAGGTVKSIGPAAAITIKSAIAASFSNSPAGGAVTPCPLNAQRTPPTLLLPAPVPPASPRLLPPQPANEPPCELLKALVQCQHGRQVGVERKLEVVAQDAAVSDTISTNLSIKGGCAAHPSWNYGPVPAANGRSPSFAFQASASASLTRTSQRKWRGIAPATTQISAAACAGIPADYHILAYPPGEATLGGEFGFTYKFYPTNDQDKFDGVFAIYSAYKYENVSEEEYKLDFLKFIKGMSDTIGDVLLDGSHSVDDENIQPHYPSPEEAPDSDRKIGAEGKFSAKLVVEGASEWKEHRESWKCFCETGLSWGVEVGASGEIPFGPPLPLNKWFGVFWAPEGKVKISRVSKIEYWPSDGREIVKNASTKVEGGIDISVYAKLVVYSAKALAVSGGGKTGLKFTAEIGGDLNGKVKIQPEWTGLRLLFTIDAVIGLISYKKEVTVFNSRKSDPIYWNLS